MKKYVFTAILLCGLNAQLWAKDSQQYIDCMRKGDAAMGVHTAMMECENAEIARHDKRLNTAYRQLMAKLPATKQWQLRQQQRVWIRQRDQQADKAFEETGSGQAGELNSNGVIHRLTAERADELEHRLKSLR